MANDDAAKDEAEVEETPVEIIDEDGNVIDTEVALIEMHLTPRLASVDQVRALVEVMPPETLGVSFKRAKAPADLMSKIVGVMKDEIKRRAVDSELFAPDERGTKKYSCEAGGFTEVVVIQRRKGRKWTDAAKLESLAKQKKLWGKLSVTVRNVDWNLVEAAVADGTFSEQEVATFMGDGEPVLAVS